MRGDIDQHESMSNAEDAIDALRRQEVDAIVGSQQLMLLRLRETEQKLRESEQRFRVLVEATAQAVWEADAKGMVVEESESWLHYSCQQAGQSLGEGWLQAIHADDVDRVQQRWRHAVASCQIYEDEFRLQRSGGGWSWSHLRAAPIRSAEGKVLKWAAMNLNITPRKTAEEKLHQSRERYRTLFSSIDEGFCIIEIVCDDQGHPFDFRWLETNKAFERHTGLSDAVGKTARQLVPELEGTWIETYARVAQSGTPERFVESSAAMGRWFEVDAFRIGKPEDRQVALLFTDISTRKRTEQALRESEERFRTAAEAVNGIIYEYDLLAGTVQRSSQLFKVIGVRPEEAPAEASWWWERIHPNDRGHHRTEMDAAIKRGGTFERSYRVRHREGHWVHILDQAIVINDGDGKPVKTIGCAVDVTEQKQFEESLQRARDQAESANRSRGEFLANMSHEIRTPMTAILGHADILSDHLKDPDNLQCVETIRRNGRFLLEVINDILDLSKVDAGRLQINREPIRPDALVHDVASLMEVRSADKDLPLNVVYETEIPATIETDPVRLRQILLNLLSNAIKFTDRGVVSLIVRYDGARQEMQFDVADEGVGIHRQNIDKLFEPFTQLDGSPTRAFGGTGLGLAISRRLARALGGDISVNSEPDQGSTFTLTIGCAIESGTELIRPKPDDSPARSKSTALPTVQGTVLVVDDRRDILFLAERLIEKAGCRVITASDGQEAIEKAQASDPDDPTVDLVLMDMHMPAVDGYEATRRLRASGFQGPIIAMTANAMAGDREECLASGCTDYISKPIDGPVLIRMISQHLT